MKFVLRFLLPLMMVMCLAFPGVADEVTKIPHGEWLNPAGGAAGWEGKADHPDSPYYPQLDLFHQTPTDTLLLLPHFQTYQQTSEWSCGPSCALMVLNWYGRLNGRTEQELADMRSNSMLHNTNLQQMMDIFDKVGAFTFESQQDYENPREIFTPDYIQKNLKEGNPIMVAWTDWGGHWQVIIGYDTMGTPDTLDDVIIMADPYDATDHHADGYGLYPAARFFSMFQYYSSDIQGLNWNCFLIAKPVAE